MPYTFTIMLHTSTSAYGTVDSILNRSKSSVCNFVKDILNDSAGANVPYT